MANNRITEGVGKKIVDALKMQNEDIEEIKTQEDVIADEFVMDEPDISAEDSSENDLNFSENDLVESDSNNIEPEITENESENIYDSNSENIIQTGFTPMHSDINAFSVSPDFSDHAFETQLKQNPVNSTDEFEFPSNIAVLKQLISKLPAGVTKQTGAMIIKQTMEALGISMRNVLQEAQQVQESLNNSTRECQASISEYKKQIGILEKQAQKYQRQYSSLNDIISLFVQTNY